MQYPIQNTHVFTIVVEIKVGTSDWYLSCKEVGGCSAICMCALSIRVYLCLYSVYILWNHRTFSCWNDNKVYSILHCPIKTRNGEVLNRTGMNVKSQCEKPSNRPRLGGKTSRCHLTGWRSPKVTIFFFFPLTLSKRVLVVTNAEPGTSKKAERGRAQDIESSKI